MNPRILLAGPALVLAVTFLLLGIDKLRFEISYRRWSKKADADKAAFVAELRASGQHEAAGALAGNDSIMFVRVPE